MFKIPTLEKLPPELEARLLKRLRSLSFNGAAAAKVIEIITLSNMWNAIRYLRSVCRGTVGDQTLVSVSYRAMRRALKYARPGRTAFFSYAKPYLRGELANELRQQNFDYRRVEGHAVEPSINGDAGTDDLTDEEREEISLGLSTGFEFGEMFASEALVPMRESIQRVLSERERVIILMRFEAGRNFQQIADLLKISRSATQATFHRAMKKLRTALKKTLELRNEDPSA